jgi:hypothetical protein
MRLLQKYKKNIYRTTDTLFTTLQSANGTVPTMVDNF